MLRGKTHKSIRLAAPPVVLESSDIDRFPSPSLRVRVPQLEGHLGGSGDKHHSGESAIIPLRGLHDDM
jgi:hypothetical protein